MCKAIKNYALIYVLSLLNGLVDAVDYISRYFSDAYAAAFAFITGLDNAWIFYKGSHVPVMMRFTDSHRRSHGEVEWIYYTRSREWVHGEAALRSRPKHMPWLMCDFVTTGGVKHDLSEFIAEQRFYMPEGRAVWPSPQQLMCAWSIGVSHAWYIGGDNEAAVMNILSNDCNEYQFTVCLPTPADRIAYWSTFGNSYTPVARSEVCSEDVSEDSEEETSEEPEEEGAEEPEQESEEETSDEHEEEDSSEEEGAEQPGEKNSDEEPEDTPEQAATESQTLAALLTANLQYTTENPLPIATVATMQQIQEILAPVAGIQYIHSIRTEPVDMDAVD